MSGRRTADEGGAQGTWWWPPNHREVRRRSRMLSLRCRARWLPAAIVLVTMFGCAASAAVASSLRQLAPSTVAFSSDGTRYAAWQVRSGDPIVVFDTLTGHRGRLTVPAGCELERQGDGEPTPVAAAGHFLLDCYQQHQSEQTGVLNVRTGTSILIPQGPSGHFWHRAGARYVEGSAADETCPRTRIPKTLGEVCVGLYDIVTGAILDRAAWQVPDLDRAGAPPICRALRSSVLAEREVGLSRLWSYANSVFAHADVLSTDVHIDRCRGRSIVLHGRGSSRDIDVRGRVLTWDTGHDATDHEAQEDLSHETLTSYRLTTGQRRRWALPSLSLLQGGFLGSESGVFGYSTHTANTVFWIASRTIGYANEGRTSFVETSSVYAARVR
jgi:hypothetical protein